VQESLPDRAEAPASNRRLSCSSRDCLIGFSWRLKQRRLRELHAGRSRDRQRSYDPPRQSLATVRATRNAARTVIPRASICSSPKSLPSLGGKPARLSVSGSKSKNCLYFCCKSFEAAVWSATASAPQSRLVKWLVLLRSGSLRNRIETGKVSGNNIGRRAPRASPPGTIAIQNIDTSAPALFRARHERGFSSRAVHAATGSGVVTGLANRLQSLPYEGVLLHCL
jgi:hypothetical protein